ncbi:PAS domain-containing protein, partial [Acinetobacter baumannii]|uniref:PAS domain-containing protein n=1 Tax=Acinetobacter baumannii TaxID=470 RepID=UPI001D523482
IILGGASGSGKSYLAQRFGRPAVELDAFYREIEEDAVDPLPRTPYDEIDWDHVDTYRANHAADALRRLVEQREVTIPVYDISTSSRTGTRQLRVTHGPVIAEGIFAAELIAACRDITDRDSEMEGLRQRESWASSLLRGSTDLIIVCDRHGGIVYLSPSAEGLLGLEPEATIGR